MAIRRLFFLLALFYSTGYADSPDFEALTGFKGSYNANVFKVTQPRTDLKVNVDQIELNPFMGLTSWWAFTAAESDQFLVMGDLVLFQDEVNPVITALLDRSIHVTALHNHFFYDKPKVYFLHLYGKGAIGTLAGGIKKALEVVKDLRAKSPPADSFGGLAITAKSSIDASPLESIFVSKGQSKEGMVKFVFGRKAAMDHVDLGSDMGINTWAAFAGTNANALVDGDFAVLENELQPVLKILRKGNINIVAIHSHMLMETPRLMFIHYWGKGKAEELAKTIDGALKISH